MVNKGAAAAAWSLAWSLACSLAWLFRLGSLFLVPSRSPRALCAFTYLISITAQIHALLQNALAKLARDGALVSWEVVEGRGEELEGGGAGAPVLGVAEVVEDEEGVVLLEGC